MTAPLDANALASALPGARIGRRIRCLAECDSTNAVALGVVADQEEAADGLVFFAEYQTAGRGRLGRNWHAPRGASLLLTAVVCGEPCAAPGFMLAAGIAVRDAVHEETGIHAELTWPNDVRVLGRKLAGILIESVRLANDVAAHAVGIGLNCLQTAAHFPPELRDRATSLEMESAEPVNRETVAIALLRHLDVRLHQALTADIATLVTEWRQRSGDLGRHVELIHAGRHYGGSVVDIDASHGLWVQLHDGGRRRFDPMTTSNVK